MGAEDAMSDFRDAFTFIAHHTSLLGNETLSQLSVSFEALVIATAIGLPLGIWLGHVHRGSVLAINVSNIGRAIPSLVLIAVLIPTYGIGRKSLLIALIVLAVPVILTNAYVAVDGVDRDVVDAANGMGMRARDVLLRAELPLAWPLIFAGLRTAAVYVVATAPVGVLVGAGGGLGDVIDNQASYRLAGVIGAAICVALLALAVDACFAVLQRLVTPRGVRRQTDYADLETQALGAVPQ
jgi:osmoprotectant transport system permease protein